MEYRGNLVRTTDALQRWLAGQSSEGTLEPDLPIVDSHHHLWHFPGEGRRYLLPDLMEDLDSGHNIVATIYVEAGAMWRTVGQHAFRPVGEVEFAVDVAEKAASLNGNRRRVAAGIVAHADLMLGDSVAPVLEAQAEAAAGRLRGIRHQATFDAGPINRYVKHQAPEHLLTSKGFMQGFGHLARNGLSFDAWLFHPQLPDLLTLASRFPYTVVILNHVGGVLGVDRYRAQKNEVFTDWKKNLAQLALLDNVFVKVGGMGMPMFGFGFEHLSRPPGSEVLAAAWRPYIETCLELFGTRRCMFESNFPVDKQSCSYRTLWNALKRASFDLSPDERADLFQATASRVYRL